MLSKTDQPVIMMR